MTSESALCAYKRGEWPSRTLAGFHAAHLDAEALAAARSADVKRWDFRVTVTGAAGFVGSHLCRAFLEGPYSVNVLALDAIMTQRMERLLRDFPGDALGFELCDVRRPLPRGYLHADALYHLSGIADPRVYLTDPQSVMDLTLDGLRNVADAVRSSARKPRIVYASSSEVYGKNAQVPFDEDTTDLVVGPLHSPRWCYALTKAVGEYYLRAYERQGVRHTIFRLFNVVGYDIDRVGAGRVLPTMLGDAISANVVRVVAPGTQTRCLTWIDDAVDLLTRPMYWDQLGMMDNQTIAAPPPSLWRRERSQTVNLGNDEEVDMYQLALLVAQAVMAETGIRPAIKMVDASDVYGEQRYDDIPRRQPSVARAKALFGWQATTSVRDIVEKYVTAALSAHAQAVGLPA